jgi:type IV pilus assembly protein PilQ
MQRQGNIWTAIFLILAPALLLGCFWSSAEVRAQSPQKETLQGADESSAATPSGLGTEMPGYTSEAAGNGPAKQGRSRSRTSRTAAIQPADLEKAVDGPNASAAAKRSYGGKLISLDLMDADLKNVLRLLSDLTGTNIVIEPDVTGKVTLKVEQVPWDQVLDMVLSMNDLGKEQVGNVIRIAKQSKLRQEYLQQVESIKAKQNLAETTRDIGDILTVYLPVNFGKPAELAAKISDAKSERGKISVDERTSVIIYTDYPARVAAARQLLTRLDRPTPQVLIEARIITLNTEVKRNLGMNLSFSEQSPIPAGSTNSQQFQVNPPLSTLNQYGVMISQLVGKTLVNVDLQIQALQQVNQVRIVAAPRVMTLDNVKAVVSQGEEVPYLTVGDTAANITAVSFKDAVLELAVTPHITPDRKVRMLINAKQDTVSSTIYNIGNSSEPGIDTRKIQTELLVDDGNVVAIGGVINNQSTVTRSSTPGLADIPILGRLFKIDSSDDSRNELLIFISPKIVEVSKPYDKS